MIDHPDVHWGMAAAVIGLVSMMRCWKQARSNRTLGASTPMIPNHTRFIEVIHEKKQVCLRFYSPTRTHQRDANFRWGEHPIALGRIGRLNLHVCI
jgi:hypothetical protein